MESYNQNQDILQWWKEHSDKLPLMAKLASRILAIPASSAASERSFSTTGRVIEERRTRLKVDYMTKYITSLLLDDRPKFHNLDRPRGISPPSPPGQSAPGHMNPKLNVKTMHTMFLEKYPELEGKIKYQYYWEYFKNNFSLSFGAPVKDACSKCEELNTKIMSKDLNNVAKRVAAAELLVHKHRSKKFYNNIKKTIEISQQNKKVLVLLNYKMYTCAVDLCSETVTCFVFVCLKRLPVDPPEKLFFSLQWLHFAIFPFTCAHSTDENWSPWLPPRIPSHIMTSNNVDVERRETPRTSLQSKTATLGKARNVVNGVIQSFICLRSDDEFSKLWATVVELAEKHNILLEVPHIGSNRKRAQPVHLNEFHLETTTGAEQDDQINASDLIELYYRRTVYFPIIDTIINNLRYRFSEESLEMASSIDCFMEMDYEKSQYFINHYKVVMNINLNLLKSEMLVLKNCLPSNYNHDIVKNICKELTFLNVYKMLQVALTIPVSSATCERSFSSMRRLKNWLRASMEQQRFTDLAILNIERDIVNKITSSEILEKYSTSNRKIILV
ncbi:hypothetical protein QTP88_003811 [Uroleucon formosanum]